MLENKFHRFPENTIMLKIIGLYYDWINEIE